MFVTRWEYLSFFGMVHPMTLIGVMRGPYGTRRDNSPWRGSDWPVRRISSLETFPDDTLIAHKQGYPLWRLGAFRKGQDNAPGRRGPSRSRSAHSAPQCAQRPRIGMSRSSDSAALLTAVAKTRFTSSTSPLRS